eukprot:441137-Pyramimonas_sp.AAC.1
MACNASIFAQGALRGLTLPRVRERRRDLELQPEALLAAAPLAAGAPDHPSRAPPPRSSQRSSRRRMSCARSSPPPSLRVV